MDRFFGTLDPNAIAIDPEESALDILSDIRRLLRQSVQTPSNDALQQQNFYVPVGISAVPYEYTFVFNQPFRFIRLIGSSPAVVTWSVWAGLGKQYQLSHAGFFNVLTMELPRQFRELVISTVQFAVPSTGNEFVVALVADEPIREYTS